MRRLSSTLNAGKISRPCGTKPSPSRERAWGFRSVMSWFRNVTPPAVAGTKPIRARISVVFPMPL